MIPSNMTAGQAIDYLCEDYRDVDILELFKYRQELRTNSEEYRKVILHLEQAIEELLVVESKLSPGDESDPSVEQQC